MAHSKRSALIRTGYCPAAPVPASARTHSARISSSLVCCMIRVTTCAEREGTPVAMVLRDCGLSALTGTGTDAVAPWPSVPFSGLASATVLVRTPPSSAG